MENVYFSTLAYLVVYSFLGWVLETIFRSICEKKIINTGFLYGPFCPIYGVGAIIMLFGLNNFKGKYLLVFLISFIVLTLWEYLVGWLLEKVFKTKYWDYSDHKFNFKGRICLTNSMFWGILGVLFINVIHPIVQNLMLKINIVWLKYIIYALTCIITIDFIISVIKLNNIKSALEKVESINKEIKEKLKEIKELGKGPDKEKIKENIQSVVDNLKRKRNMIIRRLYRHVYRLKKAFPAINTKEITEILNKKIEFKKTNNKK